MAGKKNRLRALQSDWKFMQVPVQAEPLRRMPVSQQAGIKCLVKAELQQLQVLFLSVLAKLCHHRQSGWDDQENRSEARVGIDRERADLN